MGFGPRSYVGVLNEQMELPTDEAERPGTTIEFTFAMAFGAAVKAFQHILLCSKPHALHC